MRIDWKIGFKKKQTSISKGTVLFTNGYAISEVRQASAREHNE